MGQVLRKFDLVDRAEPKAVMEPIGSAVGPALVRDQKWLTMSELMRLADIGKSSASEALNKRRWRGADLLVREIEVGRGGAGGKAPQVHVDSLPADLREAWYLERGIVLHEKPDAETGKTVLVPEQAHQNDARFEADLALARWRQEVIRPVLAHEKGSPERAAMIDEITSEPRLFPNGKRKKVTRQTVYNWLRDFEAEGLNGLIRKRRTDTGSKRQKVTRAWDAFFAAHIDATTHDTVSEELTKYIRSLWAAGERGWRSISEKSTTRLIELSRDLRVVAFDGLDLGRCGDTNATGTQFGICNVNRRQVEHHREYALLAIKDKDNATFQDSYMPSIRRDYSALLPRQIVVGDVHPVDIMMRRPDGTVVYPKAIAWYDVATNEIHMTFVLLEPKEGIRREHVAQSFEAMVEEWGLPEMLYLDNGSEYSWDEMIGGFTQLSKLTQGGIKVYDLDGDPNVAKRVASSREAVVRSMPYNAKGKPGIEGAFGNIEQVFFATIPGWTAGDRMNKKTHAKGKDPVAFEGDASAFLETAGMALEWYHKRPQHGRLNGMSPNEALRTFIDQGWGKTALSRPEVLALAFAEEVERMPDRGRVSYTPVIIEQPDFETIFAARKARLIELAPHLAPALELESEPLVKLLQEDSYRELLLRTAVQDAGAGNLLAFASGAVLDHLAAFYGVERQVVQEADATQSPPVEEVLEDDARLRARVQLAPEGFTTAGSLGSYTFWAMSASPLVKDVAVLETATPGEVRVVVLSTGGDGTPDQALLDQVFETIDPRRDLTAQVSVEAATIQPYAIEAELTLYAGPDAELVRQASIAAIQAFVDQHHRLGHDITIAGLHAALYREGVQDVTITAPAAALEIAADTAAHCSGITVTVGGRDV